MNISFDLDSTLIPNGNEFETEKRNKIAKILGIEKIRKGTPNLISILKIKGHKIHIYTTSFRTKSKIRLTLLYYGIFVTKIVNQAKNQAILKKLNIHSSKYPTAFKFDIHIDDLKGVEIEGEKYNFKTIIIKPSDKNWGNNIIDIINEESKFSYSSEDWKPYTAAFIDESFLIGYLTPEEYFYFIGELRGKNKADIDTFVVQFEEIFNNEILNKKKYLRDLSKGNQKKVGIIAALIGDPKVVILDEPFANLDPTTQIRLKKMLKELTTNKHVTVLISSHDLLHVTEVCERIVVLEKGNIIKDIETSPETLQELEAHFAL